MVKSTIKIDMAGGSSLHGDPQMFKNNDFFQVKIGNSLSRKLLINLGTQGDMYL